MRKYIGAGTDGGLAGSDHLLGGADNDHLAYPQFRAMNLGVGKAYFTSPEMETIEAEVGTDFLFGGDGQDSLYGRAGADFLYGESGKFYLAGNFYNSGMVPLPIGTNFNGASIMVDASLLLTQAVSYHWQ